ncbi:hypothetical protein H696_00049 [Fonticula alba]|uniref:MARVEL domain-containing protein n=1 Tax=Fonticula alba TaxID=691883 RepID=A0A058ZG74_FONAL|nr:hypothetical protein H696_00049 [Fonticula alba]KCV72457.1 hypothetical protein H696_00049 [Fonticula alba]|eukprot:XP_009492158.1 hypothetical protein H696_00049 [Fonticula alba]
MSDNSYPPPADTKQDAPPASGGGNTSVSVSVSAVFSLRGLLRMALFSCALIGVILCGHGFGAGGWYTFVAVCSLLFCLYFIIHYAFLGSLYPSSFAAFCPSIEFWFDSTWTVFWLIAAIVVFVDYHHFGRLIAAGVFGLVCAGLHGVLAIMMCAHARCNGAITITV